MIRLLSSRDQSSTCDRGRLLSAVISFAVALGTALVLFPVAVDLSRNAVRAGIVAFTYALLVVTAGIAALLLRMFLQPAEFDNGRVTSIASIASIMLWTVPAVLFLVNGGPIGLLFFGVLTAAIGRLVKQVSGAKLHCQVTAAPVRLLELTPDADLIDLRSHTARLVSLTGLVSLAYIGVAAELIGHKVLAAVCIAASCSVSAFIFRRWRASECTSTRRLISKILVHSVFAIGAISLLLFSLNQHSGSGLIGTMAAGQQNRDSAAGGRYSSIILFSEKKTVSLVVPPTRNLHLGPQRRLSKIMRIPFSGEYWFFRRPLLRPFPDSVKAEGDPTVFRVNVRGVGALQMQARQILGRPISVHCCHAINLVLRTADEQPDHVRIELILIDSSHRVHNSQTLGELSLAKPNWGLAATQSATSDETFEFDVPRHSEIEFFDTLEVWFHLESPRAGQSAIVSIEGFQLSP
jgi:hypothetical protein